MWDKVDDKDKRTTAWTLDIYLLGDGLYKLYEKKKIQPLILSISIRIRSICERIAFRTKYGALPGYSGNEEYHQYCLMNGIQV